MHTLIAMMNRPFTACHYMASPYWGNAAWKCHMAGLHTEHISTGGLTVKRRGHENVLTVYYEYNGVALIWSQQQQKGITMNRVTAESTTQLHQDSCKYK